MLSSVLPVSVSGVGNEAGRTILYVSRIHVYVKIFVSFQGLPEQLYLLVALHSSRFRIRFAFAVAIVLVQSDQLFDPIFVLLFHTKLES